MEEKNNKHEKLAEFPATAICANDILSSVLYTSGLVIPIAGIWSPLIMLLIGLVLLLYKGVYREVVEALPVNGGCYNALLNSTIKWLAAAAGVLTILSYVATAVISGKSAVDYLLNLFVDKAKPEQILIFEYALNKHFLVISGTILILGIFAGLVISGIKDSAKAAMIIFSTHIFTLTLFLILGSIYIFAGNHPLKFNLNIQDTKNLVENLSNSLSLTQNQGFIALLFLGFSSSLLGVSGFESSANFVEEQKKGVFAKTLRNMLIGVIIFNPLVALIVLNVGDLASIKSASDFLLAEQARIIGGRYFEILLVVDAFLVLCGAVLTAFVGISGLVNRMALDECLPMSLTKENKKGSFPIIVITFFLLCTSILLITGGNTASLGGVYAISFLSVMTMFAVANLILKVNRTDLKRYYSYPSFFVSLALFLTGIGVVGNLVSNGGRFGDFSNFRYFLIYFVPLIVYVMIYVFRDRVIRFFLRMTKSEKILGTFYRVTSGEYLAFVHNPSRIFSILDYVEKNEVGRNLILIHCQSDDEEDKKWDDLKNIIEYLPKAGVFPHLSVRLEKIDMPFNSEAISFVEKKFKIKRNRIFIGSIHSHHDFDYEDLGGVRIIL